MAKSQGLGINCATCQQYSILAECSAHFAGGSIVSSWLQVRVHPIDHFHQGPMVTNAMFHKLKDFLA
eukprot:4189162-Amphidinium_carterae.1